MASKDDMALASTSKCQSLFARAEISEEEPPPSIRPRINMAAIKKPDSTAESKSADGTEFTSFIDTFGSPLSCHAVRLQPGQELRKALLDFVATKRLKAPFIMTCVGSAKNAKLRLANATAGDTNYLLDLQGPLEIVSVSGTFAVDRQCHLHASLATAAGKVHGGHLVELIVHTTAEVVLGECTAMVFQRVFDDRTGFTELAVQER